jgi:hypothetical protein
VQAAKVRGVIDILGDSYRVLNRHPWLLGIPILLDLFLWLGPGLTAESAAASLVHRSADFEGVAEVLSDVNLLGLLAWRFSSAVGLARLDTTTTTDVGDGASFAAVVLAGVVGGLAIFSLFYAMMARVIRPEGGVSPRGAVAGFVRLCVLWGAVAAVVFAGVASVVALLLAGPVGEVVAGLLVLALGFVALLAWLLLYLAHPAIFLDNHGVRDSVRQSSRIVRANFWATVRLFALAVLITAGTGIVWQGMVTTAAGAMVAIAGNAYVVTGLALAVPLFYLDRREIAGRADVTSTG